MQQFCEVTLISFSYNQTLCMGLKIKACQLMSEKKITKVKFLLVLERRSGIGEDLGKITKGLLAFSPASSSATSLRVPFPVPPARCNRPLL